MFVTTIIGTTLRRGGVLPLVDVAGSGHPALILDNVDTLSVGDRVAVEEVVATGTTSGDVAYLIVGRLAP